MQSAAINSLGGLNQVGPTRCYNLFWGYLALIDRVRQRSWLCTSDLKFLRNRCRSQISTVGLMCLTKTPGRSDVSAIRIYDIGSGRPSNIARFQINYLLLWQQLLLLPSGAALEGMCVKEHHNQRGTQQKWQKSMLLPHLSNVDHFYSSAHLVRMPNHNFHFFDGINRLWWKMRC